MVLGRSHRAQMSFPIHFTAPDRSQTYIGETIDISATGFSVQVKTDAGLPTIILAGILPTEVAGDAILCKARLVWQGGVVRGIKRASYKVVSIAHKSQERLDQLIQKSLIDLIDDLQTFPVFEESSQADLEILLGLTRSRDLPIGHQLCQAGQDDAGVSIIVEGEVSGEPAAGGTRTLGPGTVLGCWTAPDRVATTLTATTTTPVRLLYIPPALITEVERRCPTIADALRTALAQPAPPRGPARATRRTQRLRISMPRELQEIPTLPGVFNSIMDCIEDPETAPRDLADIICKDQSMSGKLLKTVNSALYGFARDITSIREAIVLLGVQQTANLAITATLLNTLVDDAHPERRPEGFWEHALGAAYFAHAIGQRLPRSIVGNTSHADQESSDEECELAAATRQELSAAGTDAGRAAKRSLPAPHAAHWTPGSVGNLDRLFTYAVLHDIGLVVLFLKFPEHFALLRDAIPKCGSLHRAELELLEVDHCQLGYRVAKAWKLPEPIPTVIAEHHLPQVWLEEMHDDVQLQRLLREEPTVTIVSLADLMARHARIGVELDPQPPEVPARLGQVLGLSEQDLTEIMSESDAVRDKATAFFSGSSC